MEGRTGRKLLYILNIFLPFSRVTKQKIWSAMSASHCCGFSGMLLQSKEKEQASMQSIEKLITPSGYGSGNIVDRTCASLQEGPEFDITT